MGPRIVIILILFATALLSSCKEDKPPPDTAPPIEAGACVGTLPFAQICTKDEDCTSCLCKNFIHAFACTVPCAGPADCPAGSPGCSAGFCRPSNPLTSN